MEDKILTSKEELLKKKGKKLWVYILLGISFIIISALSINMIYDHSDSSAFKVFSIFDWPTYLYLLLLTGVFLLVDALRFFYILKSVGAHLPLFYVVRLHFVYVFVSSITPFTTGGGIGQIYFLTKRGVSLPDSTSAITIRTISSIAMYMALVPIALLLNHDLFKLFPTGGNLFVTIFTAIIIVVLISIVYFLLHRTKRLKWIIYNILSLLRKKKWIRKRTYRHLVLKSFRSIDDFSENLFQFLKGDRRYVFATFLFTFLYILTLCSFSLILIKSVTPGISSLSILSLQLVATFITYFAPTPGATGAAEGTFYYAFMEFVEPTHIASLTLLWRLYSTYIGVAIGAVVTYGEYRKIRKKKQPYIK